MSETCFASFYNNKLNFLKSNCSNHLLDLNSVSFEEKLAYFTDLGHLEIKHNYFMCENHIEELNSRLRNRLRRQYCEIPSIAKPFATHEKRRKKERNLQFPAVKKIWAKIGVVVPVGTGICKACRSSLLGNTSAERYQPEAGDNILASTVSQCPSLPGDDYINTTDHIPAKRARKEISTCDDELVLHENMLPSTQGTVDSQLSEASACDVLKLEALNNFLSLAGSSPVKELQGSIREASTRTQLRYIEKAKLCANLMFNTLCPNEGDFLMSEVLKRSQCACENVTLSCLVEIYKRAETWTLQRQILSVIVAEHSYDDIQKLIPDITLFQFKKARKHTIEMGAGNPVPIVEQHRQKFDNSQLDHFIDFITSGHVIKDLPFGEKAIKSISGEVIRIPAVIRSLAPAKIISQYTTLCSEEDVRPLGTSTMHKILEECSALVRKSIEGLDNFIMEGCRGFTDLEAVLDLIDIQEEFRLLKEGLVEGKRYLKSELKAHIVRSSTVPDHCMSFALSLAGETDYSEECEHSHTSRCESCDNLELVLDTIREKVDTKLLDHKEAVIYKVEEAVQAIHRWKAHIVRSKTQEEARSSLVENMTEKDVLVTCDWAMKFLPRKYREGQVDWFAKRGINWHVAVSLLKQGSSFLTMTHIHIFDSPIAQDAAVTSEILADVAKDIVHQHPRIKHIHFMSDNAGCYKSSLTLLMLRDVLGEQLVSYNFSEAQKGIGPCDRRAAKVKGIIRRFVDEGHDVTSALQMKQAIDQASRDDMKVKIVAAVNLVDSSVKSTKTSIPNISKLYNFEYGESGLKIWRAFRIGKGKLLKWNVLGCPAKQIELQTVFDWGVGQLVRFDSEGQETDPEPKPERPATFPCPNEFCTKSFSTSKYLDQHILLGKCASEDSSVKIGERAKFLYSRKLQSLFPSKDVSFSGIKIEGCHKDLPKMGWALKEIKTRISFNTSQKQFMKEKYNVGKTTGRKVDPYSAAEEMRNSGKFKRAEFLSGQQISSYFSRLCQNEKKTSAEDYEAAESEDTKQNIKLTAQNLFM